jgi:hypothetical protein
MAFFTFISTENNIFFADTYRSAEVVQKGNFFLSFKLSITSKIQVLQAFELFNQFFAVRPLIKTIKRFGKPTHFCITLCLRGESLHRFFSILSSLRNSSRRKLITFKFKTSGLILIIKNFITLFPIKIKFYDFHSWRSQVVLSSNFSSEMTSYEKHVFTNFFTSFFKTKIA